MGTVFPCLSLLRWGWMEISIHSHGLEPTWGLGKYLYRTHPLNIPYMDNPRSRLTAVLTGMPRLINRFGLKVKATFIYGRTCAFRRSRMVTWPSLSVCPYPSFWSENLLEQHLSYITLFGKLFIPKLNKMKWENQLDSSWNSVFYGHRLAILLFVKVGYYPLLSLAVFTFYFIHCLLLSIVTYSITYWVHQCSIIWYYGNIAWPNVACNKLPPYLLIVNVMWYGAYAWR